MRCPRCNANIETGDVFCGNCGYALNHMSEEQMPEYDFQEYEIPDEPERKNKGVVIAVIVAAVVVVLVIAGCAGYFLFQRMEEKREEEVRSRIEEWQEEEPEESEDTQEEQEEDSQAEPEEDDTLPEENNTTAQTDYIIPDSDSRYLTNADVAGLSIQEINYAKNEIFARHGRRFKSQELTSYFESKPWYEGRYDPDDFDANYSGQLLNDYEKRNAEFLSEKEHELDSSGYLEN